MWSNGLTQLPDFCQPLLRHLQPQLSDCQSFPNIATLNHWGRELQPHWFMERGLEFIPQPKVSSRRRREFRHLRQQGMLPGYEQEIIHARKILTRPGNWHDLFNAMIWLTLPQAKWTLHQLSQSWREMQGPIVGRSADHDKLTIFDEGAAVWMLQSDADRRLWESWGEMSDGERLAAARTVIYPRLFVFGHGVYDTFVTESARLFTMTLALEEPCDTLDFKTLDGLVAKHIQERFGSRDFASRIVTIPLQ